MFDHCPVCMNDLINVKDDMYHCQDCGGWFQIIQIYDSDQYLEDRDE